MASFANDAIEAIRDQVGDGLAVCGLSGGVDSSVAATLVHRAIGEQLTCIFVDHGMMRKNERQEVEALFRDAGQRRVAIRGLLHRVPLALEPAAQNSAT